MTCEAGGHFSPEARSTDSALPGRCRGSAGSRPTGFDKSIRHRGQGVPAPFLAD
ncbi:hypothetical protein [Streptomyces griseocarneus]|uniref:hypothetical protein n=1 Tax=Streptomyces griseocarneus TaxID=51201 RepID=UPI00167E4579|nr:hypothetical protein [Streptomyces griseocarneus]MBZ6475074.1 hypothetical protein [Streptomyces griseocarneus]